jgi:hypothetical protein
MSKDVLTKILIGLALAAAGFLAPALAGLIRGVRQEGKRAARETATDADDRVWRILDPALERIERALERGEVPDARDVEVLARATKGARR